jgi:hypothetical protein
MTLRRMKDPMDLCDLGMKEADLKRATKIATQDP